MNEQETMPKQDRPPAEPEASEAALIEPPVRAVTWRSILFGLLGVILICGFTPYNDYAVANTFIVGNFLPVGLVLLALVFVLLINAPLLRWAPGAALSQSELTVILAMMLVSCSLPSSGLMRYLPSSLVGLYTAAAERPDYAATLSRTGVPEWLLPAPASPATQPAQIGTDRVYTYFRLRSPDGSVPWSAWIRPMAFWGVFVALLWGLTGFLTLIVRKQWAENERLAFPLATIYASLIEAPAPGRRFNSLFGSRRFWIAAGAVFVMHAFIGLHEYFPRVPEIPRGYDLISTFADPPWAYTMGDFRKADIFFSIIGITFFLQTRIALSLWFMFVVLQGVQMVTESNQMVLTEQMKNDQTFGGMMVMAGVIVYIGRHHWWMVIRHMFGRVRRDETESRYLPYALAGWGAAGCWVGVVLFMMAMGMSPVGAVAISLILVIMLMMASRILAETGLIFVQINWFLYRFWYYPLLIPSEPIRTTPGTFFVTGHLTDLFHDLRESFAGFFLTGARVADMQAYKPSRRRWSGFGFLIAIALALGVGYVASAAGMLWTEYNYAATLTSQPESPLNNYAIDVSPKNKILNVADAYAEGRRENHSHAAHLGIGAAMVGLFSVLRLTFAWWPLHPIAFVVLYSWAINKIWLSVLIGWLAKVIVVRFGGASLLKASRSVFIGLVVGEAGAAAFWMIFSLVANWLGFEYHRIMLLPN